jgi:hypothetical protein
LNELKLVFKISSYIKGDRYTIIGFAAHLFNGERMEVAHVRMIFGKSTTSSIL